MPNLLHQFLHEGNVQSRTVLGELFNYGIQADLTGFFTPTDGNLGFELTGYMEEINLVAVVDLDQFLPGNEPRLKTLMNYGGYLYSVRSLKTDQSAYVMGFKMLGPISSVPGIFTQAFTVDLDIGDETKAVTFPTPFSAAPRGLYVTLYSPTDGMVFGVEVDALSVTASGFTAILGASVPDTGYKLNIIALL